ncbi:MAG: hypothetical protein ABSA96_06480 [Candidatus Acidiferrales bacterium]
MTSRKSPILLLAVYTAALLALTGLPWSDLPNHLTRITILGKMLFSSNDYYNQHYVFQWMFTPYILWDLLAAVTSTFLPIIANGLLWTVITFLIVVASGWYLAKVRLQSSPQVRTLTLLAILIASGWFFALGLFAYQRSFGLSLVALALGHRIRKNGERSAIGRYVLYTLIVIACYLTHLGGYLGLCLISGAAALAAILENRRNLLREIGLLSPQFALLGCYVFCVLPSSKSNELSSDYLYGTVSRKFLVLASPWLRLPLRWDWPLVAGVALSLVLLTFRARGALRVQPLRTFLKNDIFLAVLFLFVMYVILPQGGFGGYNVDTRMLPYLFYFIFLWLGSLEPKAESQDAQLGYSLRPDTVLLSTSWIALFSLIVQLWPYNTQMRDYRDLLSQIPAHKVVVPVSTAPPLGRLAPTLHQGALYAALREGVVPYIFVRQNNPPTPFFSFRDSYKSPNIFWYERNLDPQWQQMAPPCDYLVVFKPFDPARLPATAGPILFENGSGTVFEMDTNASAKWEGFDSALK